MRLIWFTVCHFCREMASYIFILSLGLLISVSGTMGAAPRKPVDVPFGRNYVPTWAFDHIKYFNGESEIQLSLDNYTGKNKILVSSRVVFFFPLNLIGII